MWRYPYMYAISLAVRLSRNHVYPKIPCAELKWTHLSAFSD